jgi:hypothetical protein
MELNKWERKTGEGNPEYRKSENKLRTLAQFRHSELEI